MNLPWECHNLWSANWVTISLALSIFSSEVTALQCFIASVRWVCQFLNLYSTSLFTAKSIESKKIVSTSDFVLKTKTLQNYTHKVEICVEDYAMQFYQSSKKEGGVVYAQIVDKEGKLRKFTSGEAKSDDIKGDFINKCQKLLQLIKEDASPERDNQLKIHADKIISMSINEDKFINI